MRVVAKSGFRTLGDDGRTFDGIDEGVEYLVFGIDNDDYRIWDKNGEPILYPKKFFDVLDNHVPGGWVYTEFEDGQYYLEPEATSSPGFYEDYFASDGDRSAQERAKEIVRVELLRMEKGLDRSHRALISQVLERARLGAQ